MDNTKLLIASYRKTIKDIRREFIDYQAKFEEFSKRKDSLTSEDLKSLIIHQIILRDDYNRIAKRYNKALKLEGAEEVRAELKALADEIKHHLLKIGIMLKDYDLSAEEFRTFLCKKKSSKLF